MKKYYLTAITIFIIIIFIHPAIAQDQKGNGKRIALVIGNSQYTSSPLKNPVNDATDMAKVLKEKGFEVILLLNANQKKIEDGIRKFGIKLRQGGVGLFYYAGHGVQLKGNNYLVPVGADIQSEMEVKYKAVPADYILGQMEVSNSPMNIVILDACRDNPFARSFRSGTRGLARMDAPKGTIIVYSTSPGNTAQDGTGRNAPFTKHLVKEIRESTLEIDRLLRQVRRKVLQDTANRQMPWAETSLIGEFYFTRPQIPAKPVSPAIAPPKTTNLDLSDIQVKRKWAAWQAEFEKSINEAKNIDQDPVVSRDLKNQTWERIQQTYKEDNPFSKADNNLRSLVIKKISQYKLKSGTLLIMALPMAEIFINDKSYGQVPPLKKLELTEGKYLIRLKKGKKSFTKRIELKSGESITISYNFITKKEG